MFSIFSSNQEELKSINNIIKDNLVPLSIQRNDITLYFAIKSEISLSNISTKTVRRLNSLFKIKILGFINISQNNKKNIFNIKYIKSTFYSTKYIIGIPIFLCKLII